ncbi:hypothetical protein [Citrobacter sp. Marseille-Q6884]|uniref:hypothetical protein n=1 Tax=Citrobacter sp. Marseille-Q6884 TaxID=2956786 RepID=UPI0021B34A94|nr:hypothetical protein [Citrobacter sp. Marseille-Q6884]
MASIGEMLSTAATSAVGAAEGGMDAAMEFMGMGDTAAEAKQVVGGAAKVSTADPGLSVGLSADDIAGIDSAAAGVGSSAWGLSDWAGEALKPVMATIMQSAMRPHVQQRAPMGSSGHGVQASASSNGAVINEIEGMAGGDPLQGLTGFKNLL